jgi:hypothetical protein
LVGVGVGFGLRVPVGSGSGFGFGLRVPVGSGFGFGFRPSVGPGLGLHVPAGCGFGLGVARGLKCGRGETGAVGRFREISSDDAGAAGDGASDSVCVFAITTGWCARRKVARAWRTTARKFRSTASGGRVTAPEAAGSLGASPRCVMEAGGVALGVPGRAGTATTEWAALLEGRAAR